MSKSVHTWYLSSAEMIYDRAGLESGYTTKTSYEIENELHLHTVWNACQKTACYTECMLKDGKLYGMHAERWHAV